MDKEVASGNIEKMTESGEGSLNDCLFRDCSIDPNHTWVDDNGRVYPTLFVNFFYDSEGRIKAIGRFHRTEEGIRREFLEGALTIARNIRYKNSFNFRIVAKRYDVESSFEAKENLHESFRQFNELDECV
ncbi:hypothetical protein COV15_02190 [Candidatus Woesearchaeota archaeon CG10_big_fil_rev_8_21_14_0_10_34_12]|nr:MAG: hypothetical protein COV15_02190 [Candidatus Woesearchaeota archaeon CG10_big_fil_rev_8_21_14_0_10_34_12]